MCRAGAASSILSESGRGESTAENVHCGDRAPTIPDKADFGRTEKVPSVFLSLNILRHGTVLNNQSIIQFLNQSRKFVYCPLPDVPGRQALRSAVTNRLVVSLLSVAELFRLPLLKSGTLYRNTSSQLPICSPSGIT